MSATTLPASVYRGRAALNLQDSMAVALLTPEYGIGDCYPAACMGLYRWVDAIGDDPLADLAAYERAVERVAYCQGLHLRIWADGVVDGFPHGFLLDLGAAAEGRSCVIDPLYLRYPQSYEPIWAPIQRWSRRQLARRMDLAMAGRVHASWPMTVQSSERTLADRLSYRRAYERIATDLGPVRLEPMHR